MNSPESKSSPKNKKMHVFILVLIVLFRCPIKFAVDEKKIDSNISNGFVIEYYSSTEGIYLASKDLNPNLKEDITFFELTGYSPYFCLNSQFDETWEKGTPPINNRYYVEGYIYEIKDFGTPLYGLYVNNWKIIKGIERNNIILALILPWNSLTVWDIDWLNIIQNKLYGKCDESKFTTEIVGKHTGDS